MKIRVFTWRFFLENAGYATPPGRAVCALELARAEQWAEQEGIEFRLEDDPDADDSFVETWPLRYQKAWKQQSHNCYSVVCYRPCPDHGLISLCERLLTERSAQSTFNLKVE
jgi:hypothetical protein